jgi:zinc transporter ZupT
MSAALRFVALAGLLLIDAGLLLRLAEARNGRSLAAFLMWCGLTLFAQPVFAGIARIILEDGSREPRD